MSSSLTRVRGEDRFYSPPAVRRQQQQQLLLLQKQQQEQQQQQQQQLQVQREAKVVVENRTESEDSNSSKPSSVSSWVSPSLSNCSDGATNLERFLESTTPIVHAQYFPKMLFRGLRNGDSGSKPYFNFCDLWEAFSEWSAYGAGVPLVLSETDSVVQYYTPQLSYLQIYVNPLRPSLSLSGSIHLVVDTERHEICLPADILQFPIIRGIWKEISILASQYSELKTYKSCDLLPNSWMSVAWYPIYRIPTGPTLQDLDACFLTFHCLATPLTGTGDSFREAQARSTDAPTKLPLTTFGLASHKFQGSVWSPDGVRESKQSSSLLQAADDWLTRLKITHPDYKFFTTPTTYKR
ncbi:hypothetical protein GIB67_035112 [Kingdonia uniflora]|uniref:Uncharacterized protein n=1 Tax=Kingdonia uniflora TaxID=39325 RepID=A0A7J7NVC9_9MAGN|nr:hypothetical protein GIB67_035112 [Kingdonia uniflora]